METIWFGRALNYRVDRSGIQSWVLWLQVDLSSNLKSMANRKWVQSYVVFTCWFIWKARCDFVFNPVLINPTKVVLALSNAMGSFLDTVRASGTIRSAVNAPKGQVSRWLVPNSLYSQINVDANWSNETKLGFTRVVMWA